MNIYRPYGTLNYFCIHARNILSLTGLRIVIIINNTTKNKLYNYRLTDCDFAYKD